jgi:hypothetical protein
VTFFDFNFTEIISKRVHIMCASSLNFEQAVAIYIKVLLFFMEEEMDKNFFSDS